MLARSFSQASFNVRSASTPSASFDVEDLALPYTVDAGHVERAQRALDRLALRIENARLERDGDARLHASSRGSWPRAPV